jgi:hypothetical protein
MTFYELCLYYKTLHVITARMRKKTYNNERNHFGDLWDQWDQWEEGQVVGLREVVVEPCVFIEAWNDLTT